MRDNRWWLSRRRGVRSRVTRGVVAVAITAAVTACSSEAPVAKVSAPPASSSAAPGASPTLAAQAYASERSSPTPTNATPAPVARASASPSPTGPPTELFAAQRSTIDAFRVSDGRRTRTVVTADRGREVADLDLSRRDVLFVTTDVSRGDVRCGSEAPVAAAARGGGRARWVSERGRFAARPTTTADGQQRAYLLGECFEDDGGEGASRDLVMTDGVTGQRRVVEVPGMGVSGMAIAGDVLAVSASEGEFDGEGPDDTGLRVLPFGAGLRDLSQARRLAPPRGCHWDNPVALPTGRRVVVLQSCTRRYTAVVVDLDSGRVAEQIAPVESATGALLHLDVDASGRHLLVQDGYGTQSVEGRPRPPRTDRLTLRTTRAGKWTVTLVQGVDDPVWD
jgi:hypothetical protein